MLGNLGNLKPTAGSTKPCKRVGRGLGSGQGKTAGRGYKGQLSRSGAKRNRRGFEGGQMPLQRRVPKRGFTNIFATPVCEVTTGQLQRLEHGDVGLTELKDAGLARPTSERVKVILKGELTKKLNITVYKCSAGAKKAIEAAGGSITLAEPEKKPSSKTDPTPDSPSKSGA